MIKAVLLDMDGTILDTEAIHKKCWERAMNEAGIDYTPRTFYDLIGLNDKSSYEYFKSNFGITDELYNKISVNAYFYADEYVIKNGINVKKGFFELSDFIADKGLKTAVVTSSIRSVAENNFKLAKIIRPFDAIIGGDCVTNGKPDSEPFLKAAKAVGILTEECLAVEDSSNGIRSAHAAGIKCVYIKDMTDIPDNVKALADYKAESLDKIIDIIRNTNDDLNHKGNNSLLS